MKSLKTIDYLHNFHFNESKFGAEDWEKRKLMARQITFDCPLPETWFIMDKLTFTLFVYFESFGTKKKPAIILIGKMPKLYQQAISFISRLEVAILNTLESEPYEYLQKITTSKDLKSLIKFHSLPTW